MRTAGTRGLQIRVTALSSRPAGGAPRIQSELALRRTGAACEANPGKINYWTELYSGPSGSLISVNPCGQMLPDGALGRVTPRTDNAKAGAGWAVAS